MRRRRGKRSSEASAHLFDSNSVFQRTSGSEMKYVAFVFSAAPTEKERAEDNLNPISPPPWWCCLVAELTFKGTESQRVQIEEAELLHFYSTLYFCSNTVASKLLQLWVFTVNNKAMYVTV